MIPTRASYRDIPLYSPAKKPCRVDLSDNTNLFGTPPAAERVLRGASLRAVTHYPAGYSPDLRRAVAAYAGVTPEAVATGCGSDGLIDCAIRAFLEPGEVLAFQDPTFVMVPLYSKMNGVKAAPVPLRPEADFDLDVDGLVATGAKVIYLCSPNNPTGTALSRAAVERVVEKAPGIVIIDEAYADFASGPGFIDLARTRPNVLVTRTFSKAYGMAGMRVGWAVGSPRLVAEVEKARGPYMLTALAEAMAVAVLTEDQDWVKARAREAVENRERLRAELVALGLKPLPSEGNFLMVPLPGAPKVAERMRERDVNVRAFQGLTGVGDALRIGSGPWPLLEAALAALRESMQ
ncbi:aminotransferase class I/II-fold pyridoxal phosphate-dependent enzyme [Pyxidicoccus fallax]|uniref:Aminotransferase class I/II-fold pyridoxal phosphate-dependent enzyme n=1 Tax=Pyxidicoccus fallax TaxID=394095 RepID=A0A848LMZ3_9BACT|nr:aminotransferase class I/II-fold pyridoxal phosphate-dependent enzyme [Pyxidicoccus fallax]NMO19106.1 aminotransferase class I/II-fold pyridoxal phosphate-dependent enzyme [Pyxidicoccus fallax]NPC84400.1 aminotransferase class I/II-fold pyridoxal phosphate-dependent enzyme [Pyxidicoccus fallax]